MDKEIYARFNELIKPFDGTTLHTNNKNYSVPLIPLREAIELIFSFLEENKLIEDVYMLEDWLEHDGCLLPKKIISYDFIRTFVKDDNAFYAIRGRDSYVNIGFYDNHNRWYLRVYIIDEDDLRIGQVSGGKFDITIESKWADELKSKIEKSQKLELKLSSPKEYFDHIIARTSRELHDYE
jgi:hypothetical protein